MKKNTWNVLFVLLGLLAAAAGLWLLHSGADLTAARALPYLCIGVGCGLFGQGAGELLAARAIKGDPALQKRLEVERADERNQAIADRAKGKAFDRMTFVYAALMLTFALMEVELAAVLLLVAAYLFVEFSAVYYRCKLEKQM